MDNIISSATLQQPLEKPKIVYSKVERIAALLCLLFGYFFIKFVFLGHENVFTAFYFITFSIFSLIYYKNCHISINFKSVMFFLLVNLFSMNYLITDNGMIAFLDTVFIILAIIYWNYYTCQNENKKFLSNHFCLDLLNAAIVLPFAHFVEAPKAMFSNSKSKKNGKLKLILLGLIIALPITLVIGGLLLAADSLFENMMSFALKDISSSVVTFIMQVILGIPVALYLFGLLFSNARKKHQQYIPDESKAKVTKSMRVVPSTILYTAVTPICVLYALFFIAQAGYFLSAFQSYLPEGFSYAEYARRGFFELCVVAILNLFILILLNGLCKWKTEKKPNGLKAYTIILSVFTLMLITTALSKMILYINAYGFTLLRVYTSWFMILLGVIFIIILLKAVFDKINVVKQSVIAFLILFTILSFSNIDGLIAKYNVEWFETGKIEEMDISMLYQLSDSAVPYVIPLTKHKNEQIAKESQEYLDLFIHKYEKQKWTNFNLSSYLAYQEYVKATR
ncbi:DUF4173 domain-containing protein [Paludicola sp. MB14-C6]|uniref:DUF4153 domain-containing protein n=1 Tax=Paludihabitans sp. MB14-C6 TaxID=3070656 RepID=UPI0027DE483B|nr:DUF4173 domain-containing protein [Paludicola sp. MB14-C6]WMJ22401.1 DUF4173 domain-containing protein [Paludicola sp. MB14-C6]